MKAWNVLAPMAVAGCLAGCTTVDSMKPSGELASQPGVVMPPFTQSQTVSVETGAVAAGIVVTDMLSLLPDKVLGMGTGVGTGLSAVSMGLLYIIYDPLAPNWTIKEQALDAETYHFSLRAKYFRTGGDGEAMRIVQRRAQQLQREKGYAAYRLLDYSEGIESATVFSYRVSEGTIQLVKVQ
jgi:hypothetical protein